MIRCIYKGLKLKQEADEKLERAAWFALHCDEDIEGLDELVLAYEKQEYDRKADFPWIGMTLEEAYDTKLGESGKVTKDTGSWGHAQHEFGDLTWYLDEETDERLCQAHYYKFLASDSSWIRSNLSLSVSDFPPRAIRPRMKS